MKSFQKKYSENFPITQNLPDLLWKESQISEDILLVSGQHILAEDYTENPNGMPYLTGPTDFNNGKINVTKFTLTPKSLCKKGDILITVKGSGTGTLFRADKEYCIGRQLMAIRPKTWDSDYLYYIFLAQTKFFNQISVGLIPGISRNDILSRKILIPPLSEQKKIAKILSTWDTAIETCEKLLKAKQAFKLALMQRLLTGKKRFPQFANQPWQKMKISDFAKSVSRVKPKPNQPFLAMGIRSHGKGTFLKPNFEPSKIEMMELYEVKTNDLIVNITFAWEGAIAIVKETDNGALVSHRFPTYVFDCEKVIPEFFKYIIIQKRFVEKLGLISPGGAGRNRVLNKKDFGKLEVTLPSVDEQIKIANVLSACDKEIELLEKQRDLLKEQKRGLMQQLLTGKVRVKVEEN